jgi:hypothetical protein
MAHSVVGGSIQELSGLRAMKADREKCLASGMDGYLLTDSATGTRQYSPVLRCEPDEDGECQRTGCAGQIKIAVTSLDSRLSIVKSQD